MQISDAFTIKSSSVSDIRTQRKGQQVARIASATVISLGCAVLVGWRLDLGLLKSILPGLATMKVNTAICFLWAGISLRLLAHQPRSSLKARIVNGCTIAVTIIALLTICQYILGWNLGIDELLFSDSPGERLRQRVSPATSHPGRMGVNTAVNFGLTGAALWLLNRQDRQLPRPQQRVVDTIAIAQSLALIVGAIALQSVVGYAYNVRVFYQFSSLTTSMALHTAVGFVVLAVGILALRSDRGWMRALMADLIGGDTARRFIPTAILMPLVVGWLILQGLNANLYDPNFALSLMSISLTAISLGLIAKNTGIINGIDYDRIRSSDRMRSSEERLKLALQGARQGTWDFDLQTQELVWDDRCKEMFGLSPAAGVNYDSYLAAVYPDDRQRIADAVELAIRDCGEFAQEYRTIHSDGTSHWILSQGCCLCDPAGEPCRMSGTMMEITERKQVQLNERFLYELTRRLRLITDADELQDEAARSVGEYLHVDRVTWFGVDWGKRLATIDRDWHRAGLASHVGVYAIGDFLPPAAQVALFAGESVVTADVHTDPSFEPYIEAYQQLGIQANVWIPCFNENRWVATLTVNTEQVRSWRDDEIALLQAVAAQIWPTIEQTRAVQALRAQEEQTRAAQATIRQQLSEIEAIYRNAPIGLSYTSRELRFIRLNEHLVQINGLPAAAHIGRTIREVLPEMADTIEPIYRQVMESGEPLLDLEVSGTTPAQPGAIRYWLASYHPQKDLQNQVVGVSAVIQEITDRKRKEAQIQQAEATIRQQLIEIEAIYQTAPIGLCFVDTDLKYVRINERLAQINGASVAAHIGHTLRELLPELADDVEPIYRQVIESGEPIVDLEVSGTNPAQPGVVRSWISSFYPQTDAENRTIGVNTVVQEVTERKRQEAERERKLAALRSSEQKFSAIFNNSFGLMGLFAIDGTVVEVNQPALDSVAATASEIVGMKCWDTPWWGHSPQLQQQLRDSVAQAASGQFVRYEVQFPNPEGGMTTTDFSLKPIFDRTDRVVTLVAEGRDITEIKQTESQLRSSERKFSAIFNQTFELMGIVSLEGVLLEVNQAAIDSIAAQESEIVGKKFWEAPWWHTEQLQQQLRDAIVTAASGQFVRYEVAFPNPQGGMSITDFSLKPVFDDAHRVTTLLAEARDITEQQTALRELDRSQAVLKQRNQDLDSFVHVVAHDLKAPLRAVANLSQWIEDDLAGSLCVANQQQMTLLRSRVTRMGATIDGLLEYARIGRTDAKIEPVSVAELLAETIDSIAPPPTFAIAIAPNLPTLNTKRLFLAQVFANIISNAIKHHDRSDGSLHIFGRDLGDVYEFVVADDGPGIAPEQHEKIFEIFQAVNPQNRSDSTGIGLSIVKKIIETEGGTIRLDSKIGTGTTFYFTWPQQS